MATLNSNSRFVVDHAAGTPDDPNLASLADMALVLTDSTSASLVASRLVSTSASGALDSVPVSTADSKAVSSGTRASVADSKALSGSIPTSVADSKALSVSSSTSIADSKAVSVANSVPILTVVANSQSVSIAASKGDSAAAIGTTAASKGDSAAVVGTTADSKAVSTAATVPAGGRATTTLATYLTNNATYNPLDFAGADFGAKVAAALAALPTEGGTIDARNMSGAQTMTADLIINKSNVSLLLGSMQLTSAFSIKVPSPISNVKIAGIAPIGSIPSGLVNGTHFNYTGTGSAIAMGDSSATSYNHLLENVSVSISGAGSAAVGIDSTRVYHAVMNYVRVIGTIGVTTQIGIRNNGTATAPGSQNLLIVSPYISNVFTGIQTIAGGSGSPLANMNQIVGGELTGSSASTAGSIGIDIQNGNNNNFYGVTVSNYETGLKVSSASGRAVYGDVHVEACTTAFNFTAASSANWLFTDTGNQIIDNGSGNTVIGNGNVIFTPNGFLNRWRNLADNAINLVLQPGLTVEQQGLIAFKNFAGVTKWNQGKLSDNSHALQDGSGNNIIVVGPNAGSQLALNAPFGGAGSIDLNSTSGTGTTGIRIYSGGASPQIIAQFNGGATPLGLLSQPVNKAGQASIVADSSAINTTETVIVKSTALVASRLKAGTVIRAILSGTCTATVGNTSTFQIRIGVNGTTADTLVFSGVTAASATTGTNVPFRATLDLTVRTVGASSTALGVLTIETTGGTATGIATVPLQVILPTMTTFDSTLANIVSVTYQSAATTTTSTFKNGVIEVVYQ